MNNLDLYRELYRLPGITPLADLGILTSDVVTDRMGTRVVGLMDIGGTTQEYEAPLDVPSLRMSSDSCAKEILDAITKAVGRKRAELVGTFA